RNYTMLLKPADYLLNTTDLHKLATFTKENDHLSRNLKIDHPERADQTIGKQTFLDLLASSRNLTLLQNVWSSWQRNVSLYYNSFGDILSLVTKAASKNEFYDAKSYWEALVEYQEGYQQAENLWNDIEPIYRKLHEFVLIRINNYYNTNFTDIPVFLTGSNFGEDWSNLADLIIPHLQMYRDAEFTFTSKTILDIYKLADTCGIEMGFKRLHQNFFAKNNFKFDICKPTLLTYSASKYSEILTCKNLTWNSYFDAHEVVLEAGLKGVDYQAVPRRELRQSILEEAIVSLGPIIAVQNLPSYGFTPECDYVDLQNATEHALAARLLLALRILPKLAYYLAADVWRLEELQNPSQDMVQSWWENRKKYQGVQGVLNDEIDFLDDPYIASNKPYLAKYLGTALLFEILNYHQLAPFTHNENLAEKLRDDDYFRAAVQDIPVKNSEEVLSYNYAISQINSISLTEFLQPLTEYLDNAPLVPYPTIPRIRKIEVPNLQPLTEYLDNAPLVPYLTIPRIRKIEVPKTTTQKGTITTLPPITSEVEDPPVQNDQDVPRPTLQQDTKNIAPDVTPTVPASGHSAGMYVLITIGACFFILVAVLVFKKLVKMRRPRTNNRRFEA
ncbi:Peptidase, partial [Oryctes borbonicus]